MTILGICEVKPGRFARALFLYLTDISYIFGYIWKCFARILQVFLFEVLIYIYKEFSAEP
jgi:hypothetical protein